MRESQSEGMRQSEREREKGQVDIFIISSIMRLRNNVKVRDHPSMRQAVHVFWLVGSTINE